jgi:hypothetical protein
MSRAPRSLRAFLPLGLSLALALSCSDATGTGMTAAGARNSYHSALEVETDIDALIDQFFTGGSHTVVTARWRNVKRQNLKNQSGRLQFVQLADWIMKKSPELVNVPSGETKEHAAGRLVLLMAAHVYGVPLDEIPEITPTTDATIAIVDGSGTDTVITPAERAAAVFPAGAVSEATVIAISQVDQVFGPCSGPLDTPRCQYPDFYKFSAFPDQGFGQAVTVRVCRSVPAASHDHFRLAHELPPVGNRHPQGVVDGNIEILPYVAAAGLIECDDEDEEHAPITTHGARSPLDRAGSALAFAARRALGFFAPRALYARRIDRGGGGELMDFSHVVTIDPQSNDGPELSIVLPPTSGFSVTPNTDVQPNTAVTTSGFSVANTGTDTAYTVGITIVMATDSALTNTVWTSGTSTYPFIAPGTSGPVGSFTFAIPANTTAGTYFIGARIDMANVVVESNENNNHISARVTVVAPPPPVLH